MKVIVFKTKEKYEMDLHKKAKQLGLNSRRNKRAVWESAKKETSGVEFVQTINLGAAHLELKPKEQSIVRRALAHDIAQGKNFTIEE